MFRINDRFQHLFLTGGSCHGVMSYPAEVIVVAVCCLLGIIWAIVQIVAVEKIDVIEDRGLSGIPPKESLSRDRR